MLDWNTPAIDFYVAMGGEFMNEWRTVRLNDEALERLATGSEVDRLTSGTGNDAGESENRVLTGDTESAP